MRGCTALLHQGKDKARGDERREKNRRQSNGPANRLSLLTVPDKVAALAAGLFDEVDVRNDHFPVYRFAHVINGEGCHRNGRKCLHLNARFSGDFDASLDIDA